MAALLSEQASSATATVVLRMYLFYKIGLYAALVMALAGCASHSWPRKTANYPTDSFFPLPYEKVRKQLQETNAYATYNRNQLYFKACDTQAGEGLYYVVMPSKKTHWNVLIPCLISHQACALNLTYFMGELKGDTLRFASLRDSVLRTFPAALPQAQRDSMRAGFNYGGQVFPKPGYYFH